MWMNLNGIELLAEQFTAGAHYIPKIERTGLGSGVRYRKSSSPEEYKISDPGAVYGPGNSRL